MDNVAGETAGVEGQLLLLYPVLFILQACGVNSKHGSSEPFRVQNSWSVLLYINQV
ncbi:hypothetical protein HU200_008281 [Digitaria exilis]|uniref:Uncharacterized protein n=1 Tax=Digitaria exilis TaxID=1010633 RepID=A0A835FLK0_9POAL|nr:hypothetical protein HU200_008281 [Digitaria exilis]